MRKIKTRVKTLIFESNDNKALEVFKLALANAVYDNDIVSIKGSDIFSPVDMLLIYETEINRGNRRIKQQFERDVDRCQGNMFDCYKKLFVSGDYKIELYNTNDEDVDIELNPNLNRSEVLGILQQGKFSVYLYK